MKKYEKPIITDEILETTDVILSSAVSDGNHNIGDGPVENV